MAAYLGHIADVDGEQEIIRVFDSPVKAELWLADHPDFGVWINESRAENMAYDGAKVIDQTQDDADGAVWRLVETYACHESIENYRCDAREGVTLCRLVRSASFEAMNAWMDEDTPVTIHVFTDETVAPRCYESPHELAVSIYSAYMRIDINVSEEAVWAVAGERPPKHRADKTARGIPAGYKEVDGIIRTDDEHGTPLKLRDCKTAAEKVRWHQLQAKKLKADEAKRVREERNHRFIENGAYLEYLINKPIIGEDEANKQRKNGDYKIKLDKKLANELVSLYVKAHPERFEIADDVTEGKSQ